MKEHPLDLTRLEQLEWLVPQILARRSFFMVVVRGRAAYRLTFRIV